MEKNQLKSLKRLRDAVEDIEEECIEDSSFCSLVSELDIFSDDATSAIEQIDGFLHNETE